MSVAIEENLQQKLSEIINDLSAEKILQVINFADFLRQKNGSKKILEEKRNERIAGLHDGEGWISDDFNDYLGDEFWFGEDFGIIEKNNESAT